MRSYKRRLSKRPNTPPHSPPTWPSIALSTPTWPATSRLLEQGHLITNMLLNLASTVGSSKSAKGKGKARIHDEDDFIDRFGSLIVEPMDQLFERAVRSILRPRAFLSYLAQDIALDQFSGRTKAPAIAINPPEPKKKVVAKGRQEPVLQHVAHLPKPQLKFKRKVDNTNGVVWSPTLRHKFNARVPLGYSFDPASAREELDQDLCVLLIVAGDVRVY